ncbi:hypothetical protein PPL_08261 [Heterostelium album PN500]|uniref:CBS domain-containing protein n=1 Tax=Heterostelium pallidum (strain ATCC 26659 / Pp 5 / PN500) TaxID=670386 RepID=D3BHP8_HETP5|nr:hypothetical protein PPL_08261 [Heterostelium album PN500]EFA78798.1 hypothetical protein PPL_08261 [Heterostelium album PN500]|eukprot:XP_020430922.1 hypothetical protein PPL_08261 [Heterostelium album PN500]
MTFTSINNYNNGDSQPTNSFPGILFFGPIVKSKKQQLQQKQENCNSNSRYKQKQVSISKLYREKSCLNYISTPKEKLDFYSNLVEVFTEMDANLANDLKNENISKVISSNRMNKALITVKRSDSLDMALKVLSENDISSCPVIDPKLGCMGLVDMFDIVEYVLAMFKKQMDANGGSSNIKPSKLLGMNYFKLNLDPVSVVINKSNDVETMCPVVTEMDNVFNLIQLFAMGCHRVPVYSVPSPVLESGSGSSSGGGGGGVPRLNRVISQTDLAIWAWQNPLIRSRIVQSQSTVENFYHPNPKCVNQSTPTIEVLRLLHDHKISAVAVVDDRGKIKNEVSTDSWKGINEKNLDLIFEDQTDNNNNNNNNISQSIDVAIFKYLFVSNKQHSRAEHSRAESGV